jgi:serine/threonine protein kinase
MMASATHPRIEPIGVHHEVHQMQDLQIRDFVIGKILGKGKFSQVYLVTSKVTQKKVL